MKGVIFIPRQGENIRKRKDGRWEARFKQRGKTTYQSVYGKSYFEVKRKMRVAMVELPKPKINDRLFSATCLEWLSHIQDETKPSTYANYVFQVQRHIIPYFNKMSLSKIDDALIESFLKEKRQHGRLDNKGGLSAKTVHDLSVILSQILKFAGIDCRMVTKSPKTKTIDILSSSEHQQLMQGIMMNLNLETLGFFVALSTGIRIGELCALKWGDIYFDDEFIRVDKTLQRIKNTSDVGAKTKIIITEPKSVHSVRDIPIPPELYDLLLQQREKNNAFVLTGQADKFFEPRTYQEKFKKHLKRFGLRDMKFHVLRHTFATRAVSQGFEIKSLSEILGHANSSFTLEKYVHNSIELKKLNMNKLSFVC